MKMKKLTSLCGCLLLSMCMGVGAMTAPLSAEAAAREKVILDADMVDLFDDGIDDACRISQNGPEGCYHRYRQYLG